MTGLRRSQTELRKERKQESRSLSGLLCNSYRSGETDDMLDLAQDVVSSVLQNFLKHDEGTLLFWRCETFAGSMWHHVVSVCWWCDGMQEPCRPPPPGRIPWVEHPKHPTKSGLCN